MLKGHLPGVIYHQVTPGTVLPLGQFDRTGGTHPAPYILYLDPCKYTDHIPIFLKLTLSSIEVDTGIDLSCYRD